LIPNGITHHFGRHFKSSSSADALEASQPSPNTIEKSAIWMAHTINKPRGLLNNAGRRGGCDSAKGIAAAKYPPIRIKWIHHRRQCAGKDTCRSCEPQIGHFFGGHFFGFWMHP